MTIPSPGPALLDAELLYIQVVMSRSDRRWGVVLARCWSELFLRVAVVEELEHSAVIRCSRVNKYTISTTDC